MSYQKAFLILIHPDAYHSGEPAQIAGVVLGTPEDGMERPCYVVDFYDGYRDYILVSDTSLYKIVSAEYIRDEVQKLTEQYKNDLGLRDGGISAKATYAKIKKMAPRAILVEILESTFLTT